MRILALLAFFLALPATADEAYERLLISGESPYQRVTGVEADDTLTVRAGPGSRNPEIGSLPPDAGPIELTGLGGDGGWARIGWYEEDGWVSMKYLSPVEPEKLSATRGTSGIPIGLMCGGVEPSWSALVQGHRQLVLELGHGAGPIDFEIDQVLVSAGRPALPAGLSAVGKDGYRGLMTVTPTTCSDTMSDRTYGLAATFWMRAPEGQILFDGCCRLPVSDQ